MADNISYREQIGADRNRGKTVDDMLLIDEMQNSLAQNPEGKHLIILHTKGSHFNYTQRYPLLLSCFRRRATLHRGSLLL